MKLKKVCTYCNRTALDGELLCALCGHVLGHMVDEGSLCIRTGEDVVLSPHSQAVLIELPCDVAACIRCGHTIDCHLFQPDKEIPYVCYGIVTDGSGNAVVDEKKSSPACRCRGFLATKEIK